MHELSYHILKKQQVDTVIGLVVVVVVVDGLLWLYVPPTAKVIGIRVQDL